MRAGKYGWAERLVRLVHSWLGLVIPKMEQDGKGRTNFRRRIFLNHTRVLDKNEITLMRREFDKLLARVQGKHLKLVVDNTRKIRENE